MKRTLLSTLLFLMISSFAIATNTPSTNGPGDKNPSIKSYPNPVSSELTIEVQLVENNFTKVEIKVVNLLGQEMVKPLKQDLNGLNSTLKIDLRDIPNGFYFLEVTTSGSGSSSHTYTKKITKN